MDAAALSSALRREFPELVAEVDDETIRGLVHMEVGCLARLSRRSIDGGDRPAVRSQFCFVRRCWMQGDPAVRNILGVAYLEHLDLRDGRVPRAWAAAEMPSRC